MKVEYQQILKQITNSSVSTIRKHIVDMPTDKLDQLPSESIVECLNRLLGVDDSPEMNEEKLSTENIEQRLVVEEISMPTLCDAAIADLCDFSHEVKVIASSSPNLLLAMLSVEGKKWSRFDYLRTKFEDILSLPEQRFSAVRALEAPEELISLQNLAQYFGCLAYSHLLDKYWPVEAYPWSKSLSGFMPNAVRFLKLSLGASLGAALLSPIVFEIIKKQAEITRKHQNNAIALREKEQAKERDLLSTSLREKGPPAYQLQIPMKVWTSPDASSRQEIGFSIEWKSGLHEELIFRSHLFRSLLTYMHPALACLLCSVCSTLSCGSFYNEMYSGLDVSHALSLKFVESFLLNSLSYVSLTFLPCLWVRYLLSWDSTVLDEVHNLDDPLLLKDMNDLRLWGFRLSVLLQKIMNPDAVNADPSVKQLAEEVMSEFASPFGGDGDSSGRKLTAEEREDFLVALVWACSDEVVKAMAQDGTEGVDGRALPSTPLNYISPLGAPVNCYSRSTLSSLFTPRACNSEVAKMWAFAMEKILLGASPGPPVDDPLPSTRTSALDLNDVDPVNSKSTEFLSSRIQEQARRIFSSDTITQGEVESLLMAALKDSSAQASSLSRSLVYARDMDSDAFVSLMQDHCAFSDRVTEYYTPRIQHYLAYLTNCTAAGMQLADEDTQEMYSDYKFYISSVRSITDDIFLRSRGLTRRRYLALLNKHCLNPQVKALQSEWERHIEQVDTKGADEFLEMIKWGY